MLNGETLSAEAQNAEVHHDGEILIDVKIQCGFLGVVV